MLFKNNGSNENGSYIKYANGLLICYNNIAKTLDITQSYEGEYFSPSGDIYFPASFVSTPVLTVTLMQDTALLRYNISSLMTTRFRGYISKLESKENLEVIISYIAIGRWK